MPQKFGNSSMQVLELFGVNGGSWICPSSVVPGAVGFNELDSTQGIEISPTSSGTAYGRSFAIRLALTTATPCFCRVAQVLDP